MNNKKKDIWIEISIVLSSLSKAIRKEDKNEATKHIIWLITNMLSLSNEYNCDFDQAWRRWKTKALNKIYI